MKINTVKLQNYRGIRDLSLDLDKNLNVFYGENGSGKSTVIDSIVIMLSWLVKRLVSSSTDPSRHISENDIANGNAFALISLSCCHQEKNIEWQLFKARKSSSDLFFRKRLKDPRNSTNLGNLSEFTKSLQSKIFEAEENINLPIFVYYPVGRAVLDIPLRIREKNNFKLFTAYDQSLESGANFRAFFIWFRDREDLENENRKYVDLPNKPEDFSFPDPQLEAVRNALKVFLPEFTDLTVRRSPLRMEIKKNGKRLTIDQLSDGEKCLIAMVGDLARRMAIANPVRENPLDGDGVVLIDEIDLHLHPKWQHIVVSRLVEVFPNCQFIISTHSPHVITHVHPDNLYVLKQTEAGAIAERPSESYGKTVDRVLEDLMGLPTTRPDKVKESLHQVYQRINLGQIAEAKELIAIMKGEVAGDPDLLIGADPELGRAEVIIRRKEIIGR
jgi:predicted ATP-binding protein involved in virulence